VRKDILQNTIGLVKLFKEREQLSRIIASVKSKQNIEIRDRNREEIVLNSLGDLTSRQKAIINMIFEFTIAYEFPVDESPSELLSGNNLEIRGEKSILEYVASTIVSKPGSEIYSSAVLDPIFQLGAIRGGAHIVKGNCTSPDLRLGHSDNQEKYHILILESGVMKLSPVIFQTGPSFSKIQVD
jgi:chorismate mutase